MILEIVLATLILILIYKLLNKPLNLPPGVWGWPVIGTVPSTKVPMVDQVNEYRMKYGDIFSWKIGSSIYIFLCNYDLVKTAMNMPELINRPDYYSFDVFANFTKLGISNSNGKIWQTNRRFVLRHLKDMGMGKTTFQSVIQDEVSCLIKDFEKYANGQARPLSWSLNVAILNIIWRITADRRYDVDDVEIHRFHELVNRLLGNVSTLVILYDLIPWLHKLVPGFINKWGGVDEFLGIYTDLKSFLRGIIEEHQKSLDAKNPRDFIDQYLIEMDNQRDDPDSHMCILDLLVGITELFIGGSETTSSTLRWSILYLAMYPQIQKKVQEEIDTAIGTDIPALEHREQLPYLNAVSMEVQRHISLVALAIPHAASKDTTLGGYHIPKDAVIMTSLESCHQDPEYWQKPNEFYPENFLDANGKLQKKKEGYVPFNIGKRSCPGESLAYMEIFLFLSSILQKFTFILPEGEEINTQRNPNDRLVNVCKPFNVIIQKRS